MAVQSTLQPVRSSGMLTGFGNLWRRESRKWWRTRRWWMQALIWLFVINGFVFFGLYVMPGLMEQSTEAMAQAEASGAEMVTAEQLQQEVPMTMFRLAALFLPVGVIILTQSQVYAEKHTGVAAWILSKPVARPAYLLAKLLADAVGILLILVLLQMSLAYVLSITVIEVDAGAFALATALLVLLLLFYQSFTMLMSVVGSSTEVVMGVSIGVLLGGLLLKDAIAVVAGDLVFLTPWVMPDMMVVVLSGLPFSPQMQATLIAVPVLILLCLGMMFWQFRRQEL